MALFKYFENFELINEVKQDEIPHVKFTHSVKRVRKKATDTEAHPKREKYQNIWYAKKCKNIDEAYREVLAQELLRFFNPHQPKTRIALDRLGNVYILSKEVPGFTPLSLKGLPLKESIEARHHKGLGVLLILALLINEIDLKIGNVGQDKNLNITKIDGDNSFATLFREMLQLFTPNDIEHIPFIQDYYSYNWFDVIAQGRRYKSNYFLEGFEHIPALRQEINETILAILLLNEQQFRQLVNHYVYNPKLNQDLSMYLLHAKERLHVAAVTNQSFRKFFYSLDFNTFIKTHAQHFENFTSMGKFKIFEHSCLVKTMQVELDNIAPTIPPIGEPMIVNNPLPLNLATSAHDAELSLSTIYKLSKKHTKKETASILNTSEYELGQFLKNRYQLTYTDLKTMRHDTFEQQFLKRKATLKLTEGYSKRTTLPVGRAPLVDGSQTKPGKQLMPAMTEAKTESIIHQPFIQLRPQQPHPSTVLPVPVLPTNFNEQLNLPNVKTDRTSHPANISLNPHQALLQRHGVQLAEYKNTYQQPIKHLVKPSMPVRLPTPFSFFKPTLPANIQRSVIQQEIPQRNMGVDLNKKW